MLPKFKFTIKKNTHQAKLSIKPRNEEKSDKQLIDCLEGKLIKVREGDKKAQEKQLIIPLQPSTRGLLVKSENGNVGLPVIVDTELADEPTAEDYEKISVFEYGKAMMRGMGWQEDKEIGKTPQLVEGPVPRRLGFSAEQAIQAAKTKPTVVSNDEQEDAKLVKGAFVKIFSGSMKGEYGEVEGFTEDCDRVFVKMALRGETVSFIEAALQLVPKSEYSKNARVLNLSEFEEKKNQASKCLEESNRQPSPSSPAGKQDRQSPVRHRSPSFRERRSSPEERRRNRERSASFDRRPKQASRRRSPSSSPKDRNRRTIHSERKFSRRDSPKPIKRRAPSKSPSSSPEDKDRRTIHSERKHSKRDSPIPIKRRAPSKSPSPVRLPGSKRNKTYEESWKRHRRPCSSPQRSRQPFEKSQRDSSADSHSDSHKKVKKSKKKHKRRSRSVSSDSSCHKRSSSHKKKSHKKKKSKRRESSSS